jgi:glycerate-2-kinase
MFKNISNWVIADNKLVLLAAKQKAEALGYKAHIVSFAIKGEAKDVAAGWVRKAKSKQEIPV